MRVLYFGSGEFGLPTLTALAAAHDVVGVVTQPDRPAGRGRGLTPTPIGAWAAEHLPAVPLFKPERVNDAAVVGAVRAIEADAWVVIAFGQKLGRALLEERFAINLHASLLPRWRGAAPINAAILAGDLETGNTVITLADRMDAGEILGQSRRAIPASITAGELHDELSSDGPALVLDVLARRAAGAIAPRAQDESLATRAPKLSRADGVVDFAWTAEEIRRRVHGLSPWPGVTVRLGDQDLKLVRVEVVSEDVDESVGGARGGAAGGTLFDPAGGVVACGGGTRMRVLRLVPAGKREMDWSEFARGRAMLERSRLEGVTRG